MAEVKFCSFNAKGLNIPEKRKQILYSNHKQHVSVLLLQETHFKTEVLDSKIDAEGRFVFLKLAWRSCELIVANVYFPNQDQQKFGYSCKKLLENFAGASPIILEGDLNLPMNPLVDVSTVLNKKQFRYLILALYLNLVNDDKGVKILVYMDKFIEFFLDLLKWRNWNMSAVSFSYSETEVANIVSQVTASSDFLQVSGSEFKSRDLERETRHLVSLELHSITIAEYIKTQRIPRGLRVSLRPTLFQDNSDFCSRFEQILNKCSVDLMTLTLDQLNKEIKNSQDKVSSIETQLKDSLSKEEFDSVKTRTKENVDNFRKETEKRKRQKFIRDTQDYLQKRVYRWQNPSFRPNYRGYRYTDGSSASSSDNERMDFQRSFLGQGRRYNTRKGRGGVANVSETNRHTMNTRSQVMSPI
ncbi:unnamed protein product [Ranitomeya imitator]|uniref:Endonuclease/exonuclease/phosphatase domain-containing protein n=1 Tax=Ranitomeya imitator TaxID=111125 RepID=A0ABN9L0Y4_9NEOB|nr:unnamed protein product [Ranitomeya imitator]